VTAIRAGSSRSIPQRSAARREAADAAAEALRGAAAAALSSSGLELLGSDRQQSARDHERGSIFQHAVHVLLGSALGPRVQRTSALADLRLSLVPEWYAFRGAVAAGVIISCHLGQDLYLVAGVAQQRHAREREVKRAGERGHEVVVVAQVPALVRDDRGQLLIAEQVQRAGADDDRLPSIGCGQAVDGRASSTSEVSHAADTACHSLTAVLGARRTQRARRRIAGARRPRMAR
jgi:hypothetical protein